MTEGFRRGLSQLAKLSQPSNHCNERTAPHHTLPITAPYSLIFPPPVPPRSHPISSPPIPIPASPPHPLHPPPCPTHVPIPTHRLPRPLPTLSHTPQSRSSSSPGLPCGSWSRQAGSGPLSCPCNSCGTCAAEGMARTHQTLVNYTNKGSLRQHEGCCHHACQQRWATGQTVYAAWLQPALHASNPAQSYSQITSVPNHHQRATTQPLPHSHGCAPPNQPPPISQQPHTKQPSPNPNGCAPGALDL